MSYLFWDRIRGIKLSNLRASILPGQFQCLTDESSGDFILAVDSRAKDLVKLTDGTQLEVNFVPSVWPPEREQLSLREISSRVSTVLSQAGQWNGLLSVSPIVMSERAELQPFDRLLDRNLFHLQEVCRHPITHLYSEEMRLPVGRVRRTSSRAIEYLAAHTEDWDHRTIASVKPKRVVAVISEDLHDIYENRVAVRLIHKLRDYLGKRTEELDKIELWFDLQNPSPGTHPHNDRMYNLLAEAFDNEENERAKMIRAAKDTLDRLYRQVSGLLESPLCRSMPRSALASDPMLRDTNIFVNDEHYRYVAILWRKCMDTPYMRMKSHEEKYREAQETCRSFNQYCLLLVIRGMHQLKFVPCTSDPLQHGMPICWEKGGSQAEITWHQDGTILVRSIHEAPALRFVPLMTALASKTLQCSEIDGVYKQIADSIEQRKPRKGPDETTIILYPGEMGDLSHLSSELRHRLFTIGNDLQPPVSWGLLPVSSYEIDTLERVSRALQWGLLGAQISAHPPKVDLSGIADNVWHSVAWVRPESDRRTGSVVRLPDENEKLKFDGVLRSEYGRLKSQGKHAQHQEDRLTNFRAQLQDCYEQVSPLLQCPVCHKDNNPQILQSGQEGYFRCECASCHSSWGTKTCGACRKTYPFLTSGGAFDDVDVHETGWVDKVFGMDILSMPCWLPDAGNVHICPHCGVCSNSTREDRKKCIRCNPR